MDSLSKVTLTRKPAVISQFEEQNGSIDTVYLGAEKLVYMAIPMFQVDSMAVVASEKRLTDLNVDPVGEYRKKAAEAAAKAKEEAMENDPNMAAKKAAERRAAEEKRAAELAAKKAANEVVDKIPAAKDSLAVGDSLAISDSLAVADSIAALPSVDSTRIGFLEAIRNVKIFKKNMQVVCDSLLYTDLDSLARLFEGPLIWQDEIRQYAADSVFLVVEKGAMQKASLMSNAFITIEQDSTHFNQIKGAEMLAFFDDKGGLERFDVLGGASALFYLEENGVLATVNKTDSKMLSASFANGEIQKIYYYDQPKNDGYPKVQLPSEDRSLKGFSWNPDLRPADRNAVTPLSLRPSQRSLYDSRPHARFKQTDIYFPGYIADVQKQIEVRDSLKKVRAREKRLAEMRAAEQARLDSLAMVDSLFRLDSLFKVDSLARADSIRLAAADSLAKLDSLKKTEIAAVADTVAKTALTPEQQKAAEKAAKKAEKERKKAQAKAAREAAKKKRQEEREKRWAELDQRDADKEKAKEEKRKAKEREKKRKAIEAAAREAERDAKVLEAYVEKYRKQKQKELNKQ
jgi:hypothetical protein